MHNEHQNDSNMRPRTDDDRYSDFDDNENDPDEDREDHTAKLSTDLKSGRLPETNGTDTTLARVKSLTERNRQVWNHPNHFLPLFLHFSNLIVAFIACS